jgi:hypothetical protein
MLLEGVLPTLLRTLYVGRRNGRLDFSGDVDGQAAQRGLRFTQGHIVNAYSNRTDERLGETLVRAGLLAQADYERATKLAVANKQRLGLVFTELKLFDEARLQEGMAVHVREVMGRILVWHNPRFEFHEEPPAFQEDITLHVSTGELILEAVRAVADPDVIRAALGDLGRLLFLSTDPLLRFQRISLTPMDGFLLSRVDGQLTGEEILALVPTDSDNAQRSLLGLLCVGVVEFAGRRMPAVAAKPSVAPRDVAHSAPPHAHPPHAPMPAPSAPVAHVAPPGEKAAAPPAQPPAPPVSRAPRWSRAEIAELHEAVDVDAHEWLISRQEVLDAHENLLKQDHFAVLEIPRDASLDVIQTAFLKHAKRFHPDVHHVPALADLRAKLETIFRRLNEAYETLSNPIARQSYEENLATVSDSPTVLVGSDPDATIKQAQLTLRKAEKLMELEDYWEVIKLLEDIGAFPQPALKVRARLLLAKACMKNPKWMKRAEEQLRTVIDVDPRQAEAHYLLGLIYKSVALPRRALTSFRKVLEIAPEHAEAQAEVQALMPAAVEQPSAAE